MYTEYKQSTHSRLPKCTPTRLYYSRIIVELINFTWLFNDNIIKFVVRDFENDVLIITHCISNGSVKCINNYEHLYGSSKMYLN